MKNIDISKHKKFDVFRKLKFGILSIDYERNQAIWPFEIIHFDGDGNKLKSAFPNVTGQFKISNERLVNPATGVKVPFPDPVYDENGNNITPTISGIPEFDFLNQMLLLKGVSPEVLGVQRVVLGDQRGIFDDYDNLMNL